MRTKRECLTRRSLVRKDRADLAMRLFAHLIVEVEPSHNEPNRPLAGDLRERMKAAVAEPRLHFGGCFGLAVNDWGPIKVPAIPVSFQPACIPPRVKSERSGVRLRPPSSVLGVIAWIFANWLSASVRKDSP